MKAGKYRQNVQNKAAYIASRPKESTYKVDETEDVFANAATEEDGEAKERHIAQPLKKRKRKTKAERKEAKRAKLLGGVGLQDDDGDDDDGANGEDVANDDGEWEDVGESD